MPTVIRKMKILLIKAYLFVCVNYAIKCVKVSFGEGIVVNLPCCSK
ncbi:MAG: hypothetical protein ACI9V1_003708 [Spirosomataceae bacterium]|jgi:hypothetical protein